MFPILREKAPLLDLLRGQKVAVTPGVELTEAQKTLARSFKRGIASALGVPEEAIRQELVEKWIRRWTAAFVKPEYYAEAYVTLTGAEAEALGREIAEILKEASK